MTLWLQSQFNLDMCNHCNVENIESIAINAILIFACANCHAMNLYSVSQENPDSHSTIRVRILLGHTVIVHTIQQYFKTIKQFQFSHVVCHDFMFVNTILYNV